MIKRVEILFPVDDKNIAKRLLDYMNLQLSDNQKGRYQDQQGYYHYIHNNLSPLNSQAYLMKEAITLCQNLKASTTIPPQVPIQHKNRWFSKLKSTFKR